MATVAVDFVHFGLECKAGDVLPDDHELVALAPHLFTDPEAVTPARPRRSSTKE